MVDEECVFCKIVSGTAPSYIVYEDGENLAFLDVFPLVKGQTIVITKRHYPGYHFDIPDDAYSSLLFFAKKVGKMLDRGLGAERTLLVGQGFAIDHVHVKLFPVLTINKKAPDMETYEKLEQLIKKDWYSGYIISMSGKEKADEQELRDIAERVRKTNVT